MKSKLMLIMVFAIFICTVSATCAADANETTIATQEDNQMELTLTEDEIQTNENDNMLTQTVDAEILTIGEGSYSDLRKEINSGGNLTKSYYRYNASDGGTIVIYTTCVINGNGAVIDMNGSNIRTFEVSASGVTIKNLTIINANYNSDGGAFYFTSSATSGNVTNCNFINNKATGDYARGGAIFFMNTGTVTNCNFTDNSARNGGAVYFVNTGTVSNCNFTDNSARNGGAVWMYSGTVSNCNFTDNSATENGGAVWMYSGTVSNCNFTDNKATRNGGAVFFNGNGEVTNCNFTDNTATGDGGAVYFVNTGTVTNCNFTNNKATGDYACGGAVFFNGNGEVTNCNFTGNTANYEGGAIRFSGSGTVANCNFTNNTAKMGKAIYINNKCTISDCDFTNNPITKGAIHSVTGDITLSNNIINVDDVVSDKNFTEIQKLIDQANDGDEITIKGLYAGFGIPIRITKSLTLNGQNNTTLDAKKLSKTLYITANNVIIKNIQFTSGYAEYGGAIYFNSTGTVTNCNFTGNTASEDGGAVYFRDFGNVTNCNFTNNTANEDGGAIRFSGSGTVTNCNFVNNTASEWGGAIRFSGTGTVSNCNFTNNKATGEYSEGGAIWMYSGSVSNCNFVDNKATGDDSYGGAVYIFNNGNVTNCNFTDNSARNGGAIYFSSNGDVTNCNFTDNSATENGGAVYFVDSGTVSNCNFTGNNATGDGGAVYFNGKGDVTNCNFTDNTAIYGGSVFFNLKSNVTNCNFVDNKATGDYSYGGAIYMNSGTVTKCNFTGNTATREGGAIRFSGSGTVSNCNFAGNTATRHGGAVYFENSGNVTNCNFINNKATGTNSWGGAVFFNRGGTVSNCNFTGNTATGGGGAINMGSGTVSNCNFTNNKATGDYARGGAIFFVNTGTVSNCNFTGNTATGDGGAVYFNGKGDVTNCNFTGNNATTGSAIYFYKWDSSDTLTVSDSTFLNNRANAESLDVVKNDNNITITFTGRNNLLNAIYSRNDVEVTFNNVTYWGAKGITTVSDTMSGSNKATGQKITVGVVVNGKIVLNQVNVTNKEGTIVLNINAGDNYYITARHDTDSYYTEAETTISNNTKFNVNVASKTTTNKTVNITAKSNIPQDVVQGKLLFILPNGTQIEATYGDNGTWWAVHEFDKYDVYQVNATYVGLDKVTVNNGTITINKVNSTITLDNIVLDYGETKNVTVTTTGAIGITVKIDGNNVTVINNYTIQIPVLDAGTYNLTVTTIPDDDYNPVTKEVNITVNKVNSTLTVGDMVFDYGSSGSIIVSVTGADGVNANVVGQPKAVVKVNGTNITVSDLDAGTYTLTVTAIGDKNHNNVTKNATITVNKLKTELTGNAITTAYNVNKDLVITLKDSTGKALSGVKVTVDLNGAKTYTTDSNGQVKVSTKGLAPKTYTAKVTFNGNTNYVKSTKDIKVTVKKATPKLTAKKKTFKTTPKTKKYTIVLKDNTGKAIKKAKVTLKVKGKTYKATTNSKGKATFKITKLNKKGTFKATITYKGNKYYNKISKKANIKVIVTFKTVSKGSKDKATVKEIQQALKDKGYYLTYQGHYLKVDGKFKGCTERSLKEFQKDKGLKVTGKVDEKTARKLGII